MSIKEINATEGFMDGALVEQLDRLLDKVPAGLSDEATAYAVAAEAVSDGSPLSVDVWARWAHKYLTVLRRNAEERKAAGAEYRPRYNHDEILHDAYAAAAAGIDNYRPWDDS